MEDNGTQLTDTKPEGPKGSNRKFKIAICALIILSAAYVLSFVLVIKGNAPLLQGWHLVTGISMVLGLYGGANVIDKIKGGHG
jgi:hypothetical protein